MAAEPRSRWWSERVDPLVDPSSRWHSAQVAGERGGDYRPGECVGDEAIRRLWRLADALDSPAAVGAGDGKRVERLVRQICACERETRGLARLAQTGRLVQLVSRLYETLKRLATVWGVDDTSDADWRRVLREERQKRLERLETELSAEKSEEGLQEGLSTDQAPLYGRNELLDLMTVLKADVAAHGNIYVDGEADAVTRTLSELEQRSGSVLVSLPGWFVGPNDIVVSTEGDSGSALWRGVSVSVEYMPEHAVDDDQWCLHEAALLSRLKHPLIVPWIGACHIGRKFMLRKRSEPLLLEGEGFRLPLSWLALRDCALSLQFIHDCGLLYEHLRVDTLRAGPSGLLALDSSGLVSRHLLLTLATGTDATKGKSGTTHDESAMVEQNVREFADVVRILLERAIRLEHTEEGSGISSSDEALQYFDSFAAAPLGQFPSASDLATRFEEFCLATGEVNVHEPWNQTDKSSPSLLLSSENPGPDVPSVDGSEVSATLAEEEEEDARHRKDDILQQASCRFIPQSEVELGDLIGAGGFGTVRRGRWKRSDVAVKIVNGDDEERGRDDVLREGNLWASVSSHPNIATLFGANSVDSPQFFVCEYASRGSLSEWLQTRDTVETSTIWRLLRDAARGVQFVHEKGIVHADIKANNILIGDDGVGKLTDFGVSRLASDMPAFFVEGATRWKAPECLSGGKATFSSDIFSLGMCIIEAVSGQPPWGPNLPDAAVKFHVKKGRLPPQPELLNDGEWELVKQMCAFDPADRIGIGAAVDWLDSIARHASREHLEVTRFGDAPIGDAHDFSVSEARVEHSFGYFPAQDSTASMIPRMLPDEEYDMKSGEDLTLEIREEVAAVPTEDVPASETATPEYDIKSGEDLTLDIREKLVPPSAVPTEDVSATETATPGQVEANRKIEALTSLKEQFGSDAHLIHYAIDRVSEVHALYGLHALYGASAANAVDSYKTSLERMIRALQVFQDHFERVPIKAVASLATRYLLDQLKELCADIGSMVSMLASVKEVDDAFSWGSKWEDARSRQLDGAIETIQNALESTGAGTERGEILGLLQYELSMEAARGYTETHRQTLKKLMTDYERSYVFDTQPPPWFIPWYEIEIHELRATKATSAYPAGVRGISKRCGVWKRREGGTIPVDIAYLQDPRDEEAMLEFQQNVGKWFRLTHPNVVQMHGAYHVGHLFIVTETMDKSLSDAIRFNVPWQTALVHAASGLIYLYNVQMVHGDIRAANILWSKNNRMAKLGNFRLFSLSDRSVADPSIRWTAPELLGTTEKPATDGASSLPGEIATPMSTSAATDESGVASVMILSDQQADPRCLIPADIYALGMTIIEAATKKQPWGDVELAEAVRHNVWELKRLPDKPSNITEEEWKAVVNMCAYDQATRLRPAQVVQQLVRLWVGIDRPKIDARPVVRRDDSQLDKFLIPGTAQTVREELSSLETLLANNFLPENEFECRRVLNLLSHVWKKLTSLEEDAVVGEGEVLPEFVATLGRWHEFLRRHVDRKHVLLRLASRRSFLNEKKHICERLERLLRLLPSSRDEQVSDSHEDEPGHGVQFMRFVEGLQSQSAKSLCSGGSNEEIEEAVVSLAFVAKIRRRDDDYTREHCRAIQALVNKVAREGPELSCCSADFDVPVSDWYMRREEVQQPQHVKIIGEGVYATVYPAIWQSNLELGGTKVAVKSMALPPGCKRKEVVAAFRACADRWFDADNSHILRLYGACHAGSPLLLVCERAVKGNFEVFFRTKENATERWRLFAEAVTGLHHLHNRSQAHGNIKPTNLVIGSDGKAKLGDIGFQGVARLLGHYDLDAHWVAPEVRDGSVKEVKESLMADIYSLGKCILASYCSSNGNNQQPPATSSDEWDETVRQHATVKEDEAWQLVVDMCRAEPARRLRVAVVQERLKIIMNRDKAKNSDEKRLRSTLSERQQVLKDSSDSSGSTGMLLALTDRLEKLLDWYTKTDRAHDNWVLRRLQNVWQSFEDLVDAALDKKVDEVLRLVACRHLSDRVEDIANEIDRIVDQLGAPKHSDWNKQWQKHRVIQEDQLMDKCAELSSQSGAKPYKFFMCLQYEMLKHRSSYRPDAISAFERAVLNAKASVGDGVDYLPAWFTPPYDVKLEPADRLAKGGFGCVHQGSQRQMKAAIKVVAITESDDVVARKAAESTTSVSHAAGDPSVTSLTVFMNEADVWSRLNHPHIVKLFCACHIPTEVCSCKKMEADDTPSLVSSSNDTSTEQPEPSAVLQRFFVCEFAEKGKLDHGYIPREQIPVGGKKWETASREAWKKLYEAALGLQYLHECDVIHGDLKGDNILIGSDGLAKISDFGLSFRRRLKPGWRTGALNWVAPECLPKKKPPQEGGNKPKEEVYMPGDTPTFESDIYSFGMCILQVIGRVLPWGDLYRPVIAHHVRQGTPPIQPPEFSEAQWELVTRMCKFEPSERMRMPQIIQRLADFAGKKPSIAREGLCFVDYRPDTVYAKLEKVKERCSHTYALATIAGAVLALFQRLWGELARAFPSGQKGSSYYSFLFLQYLSRFDSVVRHQADKRPLMQLATNYVFLKELEAFPTELRGVFESLLASGVDSTETDAVAGEAPAFDWTALTLDLVAEHRATIAQRAIDSCKHLSMWRPDGDAEALALLDTLVQYGELRPGFPLRDDDLALLKDVERKIPRFSEGRRPYPWFIPQELVSRSSSTTVSDKRGTFGQAKAGELQWKGKTVTVLMKAQIITRNCSDKLLTLLGKWCGMPDHANVIKLLGANHVSDSAVKPSLIVTEYARFKTFNEYFARYGKKHLWRLFLQAAYGLQHLHKHDILHSNLKSSNLLVGGDDPSSPVAKLSDFGITSISDLYRSAAMSKNHVPGADDDVSRWKAPEAISPGLSANGTRSVLYVAQSEASDVFSLGRCIVAALTGKMPYHELSSDAIYLKLTANEEYPLPRDIKGEARALLTAMFEFDPAKRLTLGHTIERLRKLATAEEQEQSA